MEILSSDIFFDGKYTIQVARWAYAQRKRTRKKIDDVSKNKN